MPLSDAKLRPLGPKERAYKVADFDGLLVLVKPTASRLWQMKYRFAGKEKHVFFGA